MYIKRKKYINNYCYTKTRDEVPKFNCYLKKETKKDLMIY